MRCREGGAKRDVGGNSKRRGRGELSERIS